MLAEPVSPPVPKKNLTLVGVEEALNVPPTVNVSVPRIMSLCGPLLSPSGHDTRQFVTTVLFTIAHGWNCPTVPAGQVPVGPIPA